MQYQECFYCDLHPFLFFPLQWLQPRFHPDKSECRCQSEDRFLWCKKADAPTSLHAHKESGLPHPQKPPTYLVILKTIISCLFEYDSTFKYCIFFYFFILLLCTLSLLSWLKRTLMRIRKACHIHHCVCDFKWLNTLLNLLK